MKKRLLIDVNSIVSYYVSGKTNGIGRTTLELIQALNKENQLPFEIMLYSQNMKGVGGKNTKLTFKNKHLYIPYRENYNKLISKIPIKEWLTGYDLMHIPHNYGYVYDPKKCIITLHDAMFMKIQDKTFEHEKLRMVIPPIMHSCKHIITCSKASKKDIIETMQIEPEKISVIYWGVKHEIFHPIEKKEDILKKFQINSPYFLSVSCSTGRKRTDLLIESYMNFCTEPVQHDLILVWRNPPQELQKEIRKKGLDNRIHFLSNITDTDLALLYNGATAMFFPSAYEGFGLPILEAMACGTLVITCRNSSLEEVGGEAAIYMDECDLKKSMSDLMKRLENKDIVTENYRNKSIAQAQKFSWEKAAQQYIKLYQQLLNI